MKNIVAILALIVVLGVVWFVWYAPDVDEVPGPEPTTEVAVRVGKITRTTLRAYVTAYGLVAPAPAGANPAASTSIAPSVAGVVVAVDCVEGRPVQKGELLFRLDSRAADVAVDFAEKAVERERRLITIEGTSEKALQAAEQQLDAARVQQALLRVESPLAGTVTQVNVKVGEAVDLTTVMAQIVDLDRLVVSAQVPSAELTALETGRPVEVVVADAATVLIGTLSFVSSQVDARTGTAEVRVDLPGGSNLRPGEFATIRIVSAEHPDTLAVPVESVTKDETGASVISIVDGDMAARKVVSTGLRAGGLVEVAADGLQADMPVVTEGAYALPAETRIRVIED